MDEVDTMTNIPPDRTCERCGKKHLGSFVWLERDWSTNKYHEPGTVPLDRSQGLFPFGITCARKAVSIYEHGELQ